MTNKEPVVLETVSEERLIADISNLVRAAWNLLDGTANENPPEVDQEDWNRLSGALDRLDNLQPPPGVVAGPGAKVEHALSELLASRLAIQAPDNRSPAERDAAMGMASEAYVQDRTPVLVLQKPGAIDGTSEGFYDPAQLRAAFRHGYDYARKPHTPLPAAPNLGATK